MKHRLLIYMTALALLLALTGPAGAEPPKGSQENPLLASLREMGTLRFEGVNPETDEPAAARLTLSIESVLTEERALERINQLAFANFTGDSYFCYRVYLSAEAFEGSDALSVTAADFKVLDAGGAETPILTKYEEVELMEGFPTWLSIGVSTPGTSPARLVFADTLWFDLTGAPAPVE